MIEYVKGSIFDGDEDIIVHGCNCFCRMGAGIASEVKERFPEAYKADQRTASGDISKLGNFTYAKVGDRYIVNLYTQYCHGNHKVFLNYDRMREGFERLNRYQAFEGKTIAMPLIGCGLAGGDWDRVWQILDDVFGDREIVVYRL